MYLFIYLFRLFLHTDVRHALLLLLVESGHSIHNNQTNISDEDRCLITPHARVSDIRTIRDYPCQYIPKLVACARCREIGSL